MQICILFSVKHRWLSFIFLCCVFSNGIILNCCRNNRTDDDGFITSTSRLVRVEKLQQNALIIDRTNRVLGQSGGMVLVPSGNFKMGGVLEHPIRSVFVSSYLVDACEITKTEWDTVVKWALTNGYDLPVGRSFAGGDHPVTMVNWFDAIKWCNARSELCELEPAYYVDNNWMRVYKKGVLVPFVKWQSGFRLPTEAEWERASKGGDDNAIYPWKPSVDIMPELANYRLSGKGGTVSVGSYKPNGFGLFDMAGNVREWCWDIWGAYDALDNRNPHGAAIGRYRVVRGGSWLGDKERCRSSFRYYFYSRIPLARDYETGFRSVVQLLE